MISRFFLMLGALFPIAAAVLCGMGYGSSAGPFVILMFISIAVYFQLNVTLKTFAFTAWVFAFVATAMVYPFAFETWGNFELKRLIVPLIQIIMFGMGTTLSVKDFTRVLAMPKAVFIGMFLQFTIMPLTGACIASLFGFDPAIAAGIVLIGSCPGGVASNVMAYLSRGNVALSVTMTACSTLVSPVMTPLMMKFLAGQYIDIEFMKMMVTIVKIILVPIAAGLAVNSLLRKYNLRGEWLDKWLSFIAMFSICFIIAIITTLSRDDLMSVGLLLIGASIIHNFIGYILGYWGAYFAGLDETSRRTVAIEVGLQNGGMASGLAINVLNSSQAALAPAIFGPWMNISGSVLASWWRRKPVMPETDRG